MWNWRDELQLSWYTILAQLTGSRYFYYKARGLNKLKIHSKIQRDIMKRPYGNDKTLRLYIMRTKGRYCWIKKNGICTITATEVDHKIPVIKWGYSVPDNLQPACHNCNAWKGVKIL